MILKFPKAQTKDNRPFIKMVLLDKEGNHFQGIMFDSNKLKFEPEKGDVVNVTGIVQSYNGQFQIKSLQYGKDPFR